MVIWRELHNLYRLRMKPWSDCDDVMSPLQKVFLCFRPKQAATLPDTSKFSKDGVKKREFHQFDITVILICQGQAPAGVVSAFSGHCSKFWGMRSLTEPLTDGQQSYICFGESKNSSHERILSDMMKQKGVLKVGKQDPDFDFCHLVQHKEGDSSAL